MFHQKLFVTDKMSAYQRYGKSFAIFLTFFVIAWLVRYRLNCMSDNAIQDLKKDKKTAPKHETNINLLYKQMSSLSFYFILFIGMMFILPIHNIETMAILGSIGLTIGLASQSMLSNVWVGVYITLNDIFRIGDMIIIHPFSDRHAVEIKGVVKEFNLLYTKIADENGNEIAIPNIVLYSNNSVTRNDSIIYKDEKKTA